VKKTSYGSINLNKRTQTELYSSARALALQVIEQVLSSPDFLGELLEETLSRHPQLSRPDRNLIRELATGVLRGKLRLDYVISQISTLPLKKLHPLVLNLLRLTAYQLLFLDRIPPSAAVNEAVRLAKSRRLPVALISFLNATLRKMAVVGKSLPLPDREQEPMQALAVGASHPPWLAARWLARLGPEGAWSRCLANNHPPPMTIRVNMQKINPQELLPLLAREGVKTEPCRYSPLGLRILSLKTPPLQLPSYRQGLWIFQDEAAQLASYLLRVEPGQQILEIGAGRGGKTTHLASLLAGQGRLLAVDRSLPRLGQLKEAQERLQLERIFPVLADATAPLPVKASALWDRVMLDAPCSGLGVIRRHPELRWRRQEEDLEKYAARQLLLLQRAAPLLRRGGILLYITCTTEPEENEAVVQAFLADHHDFRLDADPLSLPAAARYLIGLDGFFRTLPERDDLDGFFAATLVRR
jgi:16S rRNA (cytosine967-C5)-methyltransferase